jgi:hypothetical protein
MNYIPHKVAPPPLTTESVSTFGPMVGRSDVVNGVLYQLQSTTVGLVFYLSERERRLGLAPRTLGAPGVSSYRGGLDFTTYGDDEFPLIIVVVQPEGLPERHAGGLYNQAFRIQAAALVQHQTEQEAIDLADHYGIALTSCISQNGALGNLATATRLIGYPVTDFPNPDRRVITRATVTLRTIISPVLGDQYGPWPGAPPGPYPDPYALPGDYPIVQDINLTINATPLPGSSGSVETTIVSPLVDGTTVIPPIDED